MEPTLSCPTLTRGNGRDTSGNGSGFLLDCCGGNPEETVFENDGERMSPREDFGAGEMITGEYVFASPSCRQPGHSRSVYRSACPGRGQIQVSARTERVNTWAVRKQFATTTRATGLGRYVDLTGSGCMLCLPGIAASEAYRLNRISSKTTS